MQKFLNIKSFNKIIVVSKPKFYNWFLNLDKKIVCYENINKISFRKNDILISCGTNIIFKKSFFSKFALAINIHPGSFNFPGRDPHHWACYYQIKDYGATAHLITEKIDQGIIIDYELKKNTKKLGPKGYNKIADQCSQLLIQKIIKGLNRKKLTIKSALWTGESNRRADLIKMCDFSHIDAEEIKKRKFSFKGFEHYFS